MLKRLALITITVLCFGARAAIAQIEAPAQPAVTAIDVALEPDAAMVQRATSLNARLRTNFPQGYALDATHRPHVTLLQRYVRTADLPKIYGAVEKVKAQYDIASWKFNAVQLGNSVWNGVAVTVMVATPPTIVLEAQQRLIDAIAPYTVPTGTASAFATTPDDPNINAPTIDYVAAFVPKSSGKNYIAHVTCGVAKEAFVKQIEAEPFSKFTFSPVGISVYQLGNFGTARKKLSGWTV
ncbi:MAG TPA: hypothetical protein VGF18_05915 [Candidatus Tumulicola sp.]|jgi:hypothetical protein